jgi:hypothetical protein
MACRNSSKLLKPGPQPQNRIAATFAEQYARAFRPHRTPGEQVATWADLRRLYLLLQRKEESR